MTAFVPQFVGEIGASLDEFDQAKIEFEDKSLVIRTELSDPSLRQILSLVTLARWIERHDIEMGIA